MSKIIELSCAHLCKSGICTIALLFDFLFVLA
jgi:hypothetical protein